MATTKRMALICAVLTAGMLLPTAAQADILYNWFGPRYVAYRPIFPGRTVVAYAPAVAYTPGVMSGCNTCGYAPAPVAVASGCNTCATTTVGYAPYTSYRPVNVTVPVTTYRAEMACTACGGATTVMRPVTMYTQQVQYQAVTSYRPVVTNYAAPCNSCGVQTAMYAAPACSTCGVSCCAAGNCATNIGVVNSGYAAPAGCSTCGVAAAAPMSNFVPNQSVGVPTPADSAVIPSTTPEPQIAPQSNVPQTKEEPQPVEPQTSTAPTFPPVFRESATEQPATQLKAIPHTTESRPRSEERSQPRLVNPQDKTARLFSVDHNVKPAVYATPVRQPSQEELDAAGWAPARR